MPNQRASGQVLIGCHVDTAFAAEIDRARQGKSRSDFLREALFTYLRELGYNVPEILKFAPDRAGKGGRPKKLDVVILAKVAEDGTLAPQRERKEVKYPKPKRK